MEAAVPGFVLEDYLTREFLIEGKLEAFLLVPGSIDRQSTRGTATQRTFAELAPAFSI